MKEVVPDFQLGETIRGTNDAGELINIQLVGRTHEFPVTEEIATALNMDARTVGRTILARAMRNGDIGNGAKLPGNVVVSDPAGGMAGLGVISGDGTLGARQSYIVDPMIAAAGLAENDIGYVIVEGPVRVQLPAATTLSAGDVGKAGASGKVVSATIGTDHGQLMGTFIEDVTAGSSALMDVHLEWN